MVFDMGMAGKQGESMEEQCLIMLGPHRRTPNMGLVESSLACKRCSSSLIGPVPLVAVLYFCELLELLECRYPIRNQWT
jgi:hypothetical protein